MSTEPETKVGERDWKPLARLSAAKLASGLMAGALCGAIIGGAGGRLAMFLLRLTSDPSLRGLETDDGFKMGSFTTATMFLVALTTITGLLGGGAYLGIRGWFPERLRPVVMGTLSAAVGGALVVEPGGIDFTELEPLGLAIALFVLIPGLYGVATSLLTERFLASAPERARRSLILILLPLLPIAMIGPLGIIVIVLGFALWFLGWGLNQYVPIARLWMSTPVSWIGRAGLAGLFLYATAGLIKDSVEIL